MSDDAVVRALEGQVADPFAVHDGQSRRDRFVELLLSSADDEIDEVPAWILPRDGAWGPDRMTGRSL